MAQIMRPLPADGKDKSAREADLQAWRKASKRICLDLRESCNTVSTASIPAVKKKFKNAYKYLLLARRWEHIEQETFSLLCSSVGKLVVTSKEAYDIVLADLKNSNHKFLYEMLQQLFRSDFKIFNNLKTTGLFWICVECTTNVVQCDALILKKLFTKMLKSGIDSNVSRFLIHRPQFLSLILREGIQSVTSVVSLIMNKLKLILALFSPKYAIYNHYCDTETLEFIVFSLHEDIINSVDKTKEMESTVYKIMMYISPILVSRGEIVTPANIDKILQFAVKSDRIPGKQYLKFLSQFTDTDMVLSSFMSLELMLYPDVGTLTFEMSTDEIDWQALNECLELYIDFFDTSTIKLSVHQLRTFHEWISIIFKLKISWDVPRFEILNSCCKILKYSYQNNIPPFDHKRYFQNLISLATFAHSELLRNSALDALMAMLDWDPSIKLYIIPESPHKPSTFIRKCKSIFSEALVNPDTCLEIIPKFHKEFYSSKIVSFPAFSFIELFSEIENVQTIWNLKKLKKSLDDYNKNLKAILLTQSNNEFQSSSLENELSEKDFKFFKELMFNKGVPSMKRKSKSKYCCLTPMSPSPSLVATKLYLFILDLNQGSRVLQPDDLMLRTAFKHCTAPDVQETLVNILQTYTVQSKFADIFFQNVKEDAYKIVEIWNECPSILLSLADYENKHFILNACSKSTTTLEFKIYWRFFISLIDAKVSEKRPQSEFNGIGKMPSKKLECCKSFMMLVLAFYKDWNKVQREQYWIALSQWVNSLEDNTRSRKIPTYFQDLADTLITKPGYILKHKNLAVLIPNKIVQKKGEALDSFINGKLQEEKRRRESWVIRSLPEESTPKKKVKKGKTSKLPEILKVQKIPFENSDGVQEIIIKVYPAGKKIDQKKDEDRLSDSEEAENSATKGLTSEERKLIFLEETNTDSSMTSNYSFFMSRFVNDLFKGALSISEDTSIGKFVGFLFGKSFVFGRTSHNKTLKVLKDVTIGKSHFETLLFIKFAKYLEKRMNINSIKRKLVEAEEWVQKNNF